MPISKRKYSKQLVACRGTKILLCQQCYKTKLVSTEGSNYFSHEFVMLERNLFFAEHDF